MSGEGEILTGTSLRAYFRDLIGEARENQRVEVAEPTEFYLVNLLADFLESERLFVRDEDGRLQEEPLAFILRRALEADRADRVRALRRLGDVSLYISGFFGDHLVGKPVDVGYYMSMGHLAYEQLAATVERGRPGAALPALYGELAAQFGRLVDVLSEVSERVTLTTQQGLLRIYERFLRTGSVRMAKLLVAEGLIPPLAPNLRGLE